MKGTTSASQAKRAKITEENLEEARKLKALWDSRPHRTQAEFGEYYGLGNQANVGHYLNGRSALNAKAALAFKTELKCSIAEFSERLASMLENIGVSEAGTVSSASAHQESPTPFFPANPGPRFLVLRLAELLSPLDSTDRKAASAILHDLALAPELADEMSHKLTRLLGEVPGVPGVNKPTGTR